MLHLLGYGDIGKVNLRKMKRKEEEILKKL
jgi:ssRNA-specific RNase YbeY (16S rRNA maturation enzyme)